MILAILLLFIACRVQAQTCQSGYTYDSGSGLCRSPRVASTLYAGQCVSTYDSNNLLSAVMTEDPCVEFSTCNGCAQVWNNVEPAQFSLDYSQTYIISDACVPYTNGVPYRTRFYVGPDSSQDPCAGDSTRYSYGRQVSNLRDAMYIHGCVCELLPTTSVTSGQAEVTRVGVLLLDTNPDQNAQPNCPASFFCTQPFFADISFTTANACPNCVNQGYCPSGGGNCVCDTNNWSGADCSQPVCSGGCYNQGYCSSPGVCTCPSGVWTGPTCQTPVCSCQHGTCTAPGTCDCDGTGYEDAVCGTPICSQGCANQGTCTAPETCSCQNGWSGATCTTPVCVGCTADQYCAAPYTCQDIVYTCPSPCLNGGTCTSSLTCDCTSTGYEGSTCDTPVCTSPCQNGGTCSAPDTCQCPPTYNGPTCENPVCSQPCQHGSTCVGVNQCDCGTTGYSGSDCSQPVCVQQCLNSGTCIQPNVCNCTASYTGVNCSTPVCNPGCPLGSHCLSPNQCSLVPSVKSATSCPTKGGSITIIGTNFSNNSKSITVVVGGSKTCNVTWSNSTSIVCTMPPGTGSNYFISVTVAGVSNSQDKSNLFSYAAPIITSSSPAPNGGGTTYIYGSNFGTNATQIIIYVNSSKICTNVTIISETTIACNISAGQGENLPISVTVNGTTTTVNSTFSYIGLCGDGLCYGSENCVTCALDCPTPCGLCGDSICSENETCSTCYEDCRECNPTATCGNPVCSNQGSCVEGVCQCAQDWAGPYCNQKTIPINVTITNDTQIITYNGVTFNIAVVAINEVDQNGQIVQSLLLTNSNNNASHQQNTSATPYPTPKPSNSTTNSTTNSTLPTQHPTSPSTPKPTSPTSTPTPTPKKREARQLPATSTGPSTTSTSTSSKSSTTSATTGMTSSNSTTTNTTHTNTSSSTSTSTSTTTAHINSTTSTTGLPSNQTRSNTTTTTTNSTSTAPVVYSLSFNSSKAMVSTVYTLYTTNTTVTFANTSLSFAPQTVKVVVNISRWAFLSTKNSLQIVMSGGLPDSLDPCLDSVQNDTSGNLEWYSISNGNADFYARAFPLGIVDTRVKRLNTFINNSNIITEVPFFWTSAVVDPDFAVLLKNADNPNPSTASQNQCSLLATKNNSFNKQLFLEVALPVFVAVAGALTGVFGYHHYQKKHGKHGLYTVQKKTASTSNLTGSSSSVSGATDA